MPPTTVLPTTLQPSAFHPPCRLSAPLALLPPTRCRRRFSTNFGPSRSPLRCLPIRSDSSSPSPFSKDSNGLPHRSLAREKSLPQVPQSGTVIFMAIANEFSMASLYRRLLRAEFSNVVPSANGSVLHLSQTPPPSDRLAEAFVFPYGCLVVWGNDEDCEHFLSLVVDDAFQVRPSPAVDTMHYQYGKTGSLRRDIITLEADPDSRGCVGISGRGMAGGHFKREEHSEGNGVDNSDALRPELERMSISCGLAQSIKLGAFESAMRSTIENTRHLPEQLASSGEITSSRRDVARLMGRLFLDRYRYHLSGDLLVTPAFFWENEQYLPSYQRVERYLEVRERGDVLNKRVEVVQELYKLLGDELANQNSMALELAITVMIAFEVLLTFVTLAKENMRSLSVGCALFFGLSFLAWVLWRLYRRRRSSEALNRYTRALNVE